jgi:hypothetical protein
VGLARDPLSLVRINEELLERKVATPVKKLTINGREGSAALTTRRPSNRKSRHYFDGRDGRSVGIVRLWTKSHGISF